MQNDLTNNIELSIERVLSRFVSGSNLIKVKSLLDDKSFNLNFRWKSYIGENEFNLDLHDIVIPGKQAGTTAIKKLILANPGIGKSTFSFSVYKKMFDKYKLRQTQSCPIYIDLAEYRGNLDFGTFEWTNQYLKSISGNSNILWTQSPDISEAFQVAPYFILDSLDEYLADCTISEIQHQLNKYIFKEVNLISCRTQFFEFYISSSNKLFVTSFDKIILLEWQDIYHENYTKWYFERFSTQRSVNVPLFLEKLKHSKDLWELCKVPIRYNMILEILSKNSMNFNLVSKLIRIYHNYSIMTIQHESSRNGSVLTLDDKISCLKKVAWSFYDERKIGDGFEKIRFSEETLKSVLLEDEVIATKYSDIEGVIKDLIKGSVFLEDTNDEYENSFTSIKFSHKSIQEYFVARYIYECLTAAESSFELARVYQSFISQEIDQFFKDYISKLNTDLNLSKIACKNYIEAYNANNADELDSSELILRKRIAKEQIAYNLGHLQTEESYLFLTTLLETEKDEFLRRSMTIGLSFGGYTQVLNDYVDSLRSDFQSEANKINVAMHLSYFGDQSFEILKADVDQGLPKCSNTVKKLIHVINEEKNRGSWRIDLYTIIFLSQNREISKHSCLETISENLTHFISAIEQFEKDNMCKDWPEIEEAKILINKIAKK